MRAKSILPAVLYLFIITACQSLPANFDAAKFGKVERDITYCIMQGVELKMDMYYPTARQKQWPVVVHIHGGGWTSGTKGLDSMIDVNGLSKVGILLVSAEYRLAPEYKFPAMIEDVKCAVRYLRPHAAKYNIDST